MGLRSIDIKRKLFLYKTPIVYTLSSVLKALGTIASGFIIAKFVSPSDLGLWSALTLLLSYALIFQGGVINGLNLELPLSLGQGNVDKSRLYVGVVQTFIFYASLIVVFLAVLVYSFYSFNSDKERLGFLGLSIIVVFTFYQNFLLSTFRSNQEFLKLSYIQIGEAALNICTLLFVVYFTFYGMVLKAVLVIFLFVALLFIYRPIKVGMKWDRQVFLHLLKVGIPIFALAYVEVLALTFDKILLLKYANLEAIGIFSFAFYSFAFTTLFSSSLASYIYPKLTYKYGEQQDKTILWVYVKKITLLLLLVQVPVAAVGYFLIPLLISAYFPNYIESTFPMQILLFAGVLKGAVIGANVLWSIKKWKYMIFYQVSYAVLFIGFTFLFVHICSNKVVGVSYGILVANLVNLANGVWLSYRATKKK